MSMTLSSTLSTSALQHSPAPPQMAAKWPLLGSLPYLGRQGLDFLLQQRAMLGDIFAVDLGAAQMIALCHPRHAQHVLRDNARNYEKGGAFWDNIRTLLGNGLPVSEGEFWLRQRRMLQPQFHRQRLEMMLETMVEAIDQCLEPLHAAARSGEPINLAQQLTRITMNVVVRTMFGSGLDEASVATVAHNMSFIVEHLLRGMLLGSLPKWLPVPGRRKYLRMVAEIDAIIYRLIEERRQNPGEIRGDLLGMMIDMVDDQSGERMSEQTLRDEAISMFLAGYETTAAALAFCFQQLAEQPALCEKLKAELSSTKGPRPNLLDLRQWVLTRGTVQEALRLFPPAYWLPRVAVEDDVIDGIRIPKGTMVAVMIYVIHRNPEIWPDVERFDPGRFTAEQEAVRHPLAWMPFGAGQRLCIGKEFALMEGQLILQRILSQFTLAKVPERPVKVSVAAVLRPKDGVYLRLQSIRD